MIGNKVRSSQSTVDRGLRTKIRILEFSFCTLLRVYP
jgi:hypothetical protein